MKTNTPHPIGRLMPKRHLRVLGINSGTSIDGLDLALVRIREERLSRSIRLLDIKSFRFPRVLRETLADLADSNRVSKELVARAHFALGEWIARRVCEFSQEHRPRRSIDLIACHGQTIGHFPSPGRARGVRHGATWQIGSHAIIAHQTGIVTVGDFRSGDIAAGGMGAPLSGYYHYLLFGRDHVVLNLGGIANISVARTTRNRLEVLAFDVGPANMMIDALARLTLARPFDPDGLWAKSGTPDMRMVNRILSTPYFRRRPPKTCGREEFGPKSVAQWFQPRSHVSPDAADLLATAVEVTATAVSRAVRRWVEPFSPVRSMILVGGGTKNGTLVGRLADLLREWTVSTSVDWGIPAQFVEPAGFAILGYETLRGRPGNLGGATGAAAAILGSISLP